MKDIFSYQKDYDYICRIKNYNRLMNKINTKLILLSLTLFLTVTSCVKKTNGIIEDGPETAIGLTHDNLAGKWEIFYNNKLVKVGKTSTEAIGTDYRYTDLEGFSVEFYDGGRVDGDKNKGRFKDRNVFDMVTQEGTYELILKPVNVTQGSDSIRYHFKSKATGNDSITTFAIPGVFENHLARYQEYWQALDKTATVKYYIADTYFYRNVDKDENYQLKGKNKNLLDKEQLIGDWQFSSYGESLNGKWNYNVKEQTGQYGEVLRLNADGTYVNFTKADYNQNPKNDSKKGYYRVIDDLIQLYRIAETANGKDTLSSKLWIKDPIVRNSKKQLVFTHYDKFRDANNHANVIEREGKYIKISD